MATGPGTFTTVSASGNITGGNINTGGRVSAALLGGAQISTSGNVTGSYFIGNGSRLTGLSVANIGVQTSLSATGNITGGNVSASSTISSASLSISGTANIGGTLNTAQINTTNLSASGSLQARTLSGVTVSATGSVIVPTITANSISTTNLSSGAVSVTGDVLAFGAVSGAAVSVIGTVTGANLNISGGGDINGVLSARGGIVGVFAGAASAQPNITSLGTLTNLSVTGNVATGSNLTAGGLPVVTSAIKRNITVSASAPASGDGNVGDIWYQTF